MPSRILPGIGLNGFWGLGEQWKVGGDENWLKLSVLAQLVVESATAALPSSPDDGYIAIVPNGAEAGKIAVRDNGEWVYLEPINGMRAWVSDVDTLYRFKDGTWEDVLTKNAIPVGFVAWWADRNNLPGGWVAADGQEVSRTTFPDAAALVTDGKVPVVAENDWQSTPTLRGSYTAGDGSTTVRLPDYNGKSAGSIAAVMLRGDGALSAGTPGVIQQDALQNITGQFGIRASSTGASMGGQVGGSIKVEQVGNDIASVTVGSPNQTSWLYTFDASRVARTDVETRSTNVTGCWAIKLFGAPANIGVVDVTQLASDFAALVAQAYTRTNIVGTVSQESGVPTGAIIESGGNANGEYVRFADGTQICWKTVQLDAASNPGGTAMFFSTISAGALEPFPAAFQEVFGGSVALETNTAQWGQVNFTPGGLSAFVASAISRTSGVTANVTIFGRWF
jgi:Protein of unknown function (DUF2793).